MVIGSIVESQKLINQAMKIKEKGDELNMCKALEKLMNKNKEEGQIKGMVLTCRKFKISEEETLKNLIEEFTFSEEEANTYLEKYWK